MTVILATALVVQAAAIVLLRHRLGRHWLRHPVVLLVVASVVYQGVSPLLMTIPSVRAWNTYRNGIQQSFTDSATLLMSAGVLALTVAYLLTHPECADVPPAEDDVAKAARALDWRLLTLACVPLAVLTYEGRGYNDAEAMNNSTPVTTDLAATFFTLLIVLAAFALLLRCGGRWFLPVLVTQSLLLAAAGERTPILIDAIVLILLLARAGMRPTVRQLHAALGFTLLGILAITGSRVEQGRSLYYTDSGLLTRLAALENGLFAGTSGSQATPGLVAQAAVRLDGVDFAGAILEAEHLGQPRLSAAYVPESLLLAVPSAAWSSKLSHANGLNPFVLEIADFGLQDTNFLPGLPGLYMGFLSPPWLVAFLAVLGALAGWAERWLLRSCTPARLVLLAGAVTAALWLEPGLPSMLVDLRAAVAVAGVVKLAQVVRERRSRKDAVPVLGHPGSAEPRPIAQKDQSQQPLPLRAGGQET
jgi:hypothetical protein